METSSDFDANTPDKICFSLKTLFYSFLGLNNNILFRLDFEGGMLVFLRISKIDFGYAHTLNMTTY